MSFLNFRIYCALLLIFDRFFFYEKYINTWNHKNWNKFQYKRSYKMKKNDTFSFSFNLHRSRRLLSLTLMFVYTYRLNNKNWHSWSLIFFMNCKRWLVCLSIIRPLFAFICSFKVLNGSFENLYFSRKFVSQRLLSCNECFSNKNSILNNAFMCFFFFCFNFSFYFLT